MGVAGVNITIGANTEKFKSQMAKAQASVSRFGKSTVNLNRKLKKLGKGFTNVGKQLSMGLTAPIVAMGALAVKAFEEQIVAERRLEDAIGGAAEALKKQAAELQKTTRFGDEATMAVQAQLATLGLTEKQILKLTPLVQDLAARTGKDLSKSAKEVTSALSTGATTLEKYGVELTSTNTLAENIDITIQGLTESVGGQAEVLAGEGMGSLIQMQNAMGDLMEQFGEIIAEGIKPFVTKIKELAERFQKLSPETKKMIVMIAGLAAAVGPLLVVLGFLISTVLPALITGFALLLGPIGLVVVAIGIAVFEIQRNWDDIVDYFTTGPAAETWLEFQELTEKVFGTLPDSMGTSSEMITKIWDQFVASFIRPIKFGFETILRIVKTTMGVFGDYIDIGTAIIARDWATVFNEMKSILIRIFSAMVSGVTAGISLILGAVGGLVSFFNEDWAESLAKAQETVNSFGKTLIEGAGDFIGYKREVKAATKEVDELADALDEVDDKVGDGDGDGDGDDKGDDKGKEKGKGKDLIPLIEQLKKARKEAELFSIAFSEGPIKTLERARSAVKAYIDAALAKEGGISQEIQMQIDAYNRLGIAIDDINTKQTALIAKQEEMKERSEAVAGAVGGAFESMANRFIESQNLAATGMGEFTKQIMQLGAKLISMLIQQAIKNIAIRQAESMANSISGATAAGATTGPAAPIATPIFIATAIAGVLSAFAAITGFEKGGLVFGETLGIIGEGRGTSRSNPEVIAPLDKLQNMISGMGGGGGVTEFVLRGETLRAVTNKVADNRSFTVRE